jgi:hypothetical protein
MVNTSRYKRNGLLPMLKRNTSVKLAPQRWQDNASDGPFDMIMTFEERVFDLVVEGRSFAFGLELDFALRDSSSSYHLQVVAFPNGSWNLFSVSRYE